MTANPHLADPQRGHTDRLPVDADARLSAASPHRWSRCRSWMIMAPRTRAPAAASGAGWPEPGEPLAPVKGRSRSVIDRAGVSADRTTASVPAANPLHDPDVVAAERQIVECERRPATPASVQRHPAPLGVDRTTRVPVEGAAPGAQGLGGLLGGVPEARSPHGASGLPRPVAALSVACGAGGVTACSLNSRARCRRGGPS